MIRLTLIFALTFAALVADAPAGRTSEGALADRVREICAERPSRVTTAFCSMEARTISLVGPDDRRAEIEVLVADDSVRRAAGYQFISEDVVRQTAILFIFERATSGAFHMCNVEVPLDIAWFRESGSALDALTMQPGGVGDPGRCRQLYQPRRFGTYWFALETPVGGLQELGIDDVDEWTLDVGSLGRE